MWKRSQILYKWFFLAAKSSYSYAGSIYISVKKFYKEMHITYPENIHSVLHQKSSWDAFAEKIQVVKER